jgi:Na+-translocating ferredoxin:NAD+ oxidoreductase subunit D
MSDLYIVSSSPHMRSKDSVTKTMLDVVIALLPATVFGVYSFGFRALMITLLAVVSSVGFEFLYQKVAKQKSSIHDLSAVVTGLLLAMNLPSQVPYWMPILGSLFAIIIVKQLFGGLGQNFMNPALAARAFLLVSFADIMTTWVTPLDAITTATPLALLKEGATELPALSDAFIGMIAGSIGETSVLALLLGGIYLLLRKVISWRIPVTYIGTVALMVLVFGGQGFDMTFLGYHLFTGGLILGAFFMATDYSSSPTTAIGQIIMGVGCGLLTALIRLFGGYPEGVSFAILIMNLFVPLIDKYTLPRVFGEVK